MKFVLRNRLSKDVTLLLLLAGLVCIASGCTSTLAGGHNNSGVRDFQNGDLEAAERRFRTAVKLNPRHADAHYNLGTVLHRRGIRDNDQGLLLEAERLYDACLTLNEEHVEAHREWAVLLAQTGRSKDAFKLLTNWRIRSPRSADAHVELARLTEEFGDADTAKFHLEEALERAPRHAKARAALAYLHERSGEFDDARQNYELAYRGNRDPNVASRLARIGSYSNRPRDGAASDEPQTATNGWTERERR
jgi:tetratricopeptide (TPR) repeat protein